MAIAAFVINRTVVRNPAPLIRRCEAAARAAGWEPAFVPTASAAVATAAGLVFALGGDGTVHGCARALAGTATPLAIVPLGTANLTARALGIPLRTSHAIEAGFSGADHRVDLARAGETVFTAMAGIGLDATVVAATRQRAKRRLGWIAYAASGAARLSMPRAEFTVTLDHGKPMTRTAHCVVAGNSGLLPGGFTLLPQARLDDGLLDVGVLAPEGPLGWALVAGRVLTRDAPARYWRRDRRLERYQARHVEISCGMNLPRQADGELLEPGRSLTISVWPGALTVRLPV